MSSILGHSRLEEDVLALRNHSLGSLVLSWSSSPGRTTGHAGVVRHGLVLLLVRNYQQVLTMTSLGQKKRILTLGKNR